MTKLKSGRCIDCPKNSQEKPLTTKRCQHHYWIYRAEVAESKKRMRDKMNEFLGKPKKVVKPISKVSAKMKISQKQYLKTRADYINNHPKCEAGIICKGLSSATDIHHKRGKIGSLLSDARYFLAVCRPCHHYIEENPTEAKEKGYSLSRLATVGN